MRLIIRLLTHAALASTLTVYAAGPVYQWIDAQGVTHFSEVLPATAGPEVSRIEFAPLPPPAAGDDYYSVINQAMRMEQRRLEAEAAKTQRLRAQAAADRARAEAAAAANPVPAPEADVIYLPGYPYYPRHQRHWHPEHQLPRHDRRPSGPWPVQTLKPPGPRPYPYRLR
jgi:hypothetical protein